MAQFITKKTAGTILTMLLSILILFHLSIIFRLFPSNIIWGGKASENNLFLLEIFSIVLTFIFILIAVTKSGFLKNQVLEKISAIGIWIMVAYFSLNIIGNIMAETAIEKLIFTPLSAMLLLCSIRLSLKR